MVDQSTADILRQFFDPVWYLERNPDVGAAGIDPLAHYIAHGVNEGRDPNPFFDSEWYLSNYPDVGGSELSPLLHYLWFGAAELRNPNPRFDAVFYAGEHPESALNPLLYHMLFGTKQGWPTEPVVDIADYLPSSGTFPTCPDDIAVDVIVPVYRGLEQTRRCLESVLADPDRLPGRIIVIDDCSPEPELSAWLDSINGRGGLHVLRNPRNLGFVMSVNRGLEAARLHDVVLLNSDTEVPPDWLRRLAGHAYSAQRIGTVSPFSNRATICSYPSQDGGPAPFGLQVGVLDRAAQAANAGRTVEVPTTVGFCMFIRRACIAEVGMLDAQAFGRGYGEENDFCLRATARGWRHLLACDTFVFHEGEVSFAETAASQQSAGLAVLADRYPQYHRQIALHVRRNLSGPPRFALTSAIFRQSGLPVILMISHGLGGGVERHIKRLVAKVEGRAHCLLLRVKGAAVVITAPALAGHPELRLPCERTTDIMEFLRAQNIVRAHVHHVAGSSMSLHALIHGLGVPFDFTAHDYFTICPQINLLPQLDGQYCGEPGPGVCNACIAIRPSSGARDILTWRHQHRWLMAEAQRVFCPTEDVLARLARYGMDNRGVYAPHEPVKGAPWIVTPPKLKPNGKLRVAVVGVLADQKGLPAFVSVVRSASTKEFEFHLIGYPERPLPADIARKVRQTGEYDDEDLPALIAKVAPHIAWFPAQWPETYSYTLSSAIDAGLPVVASDIGAFAERLRGRPLTWLVDPSSTAEGWLRAFGAASEHMRAGKRWDSAERRAEPDFYRDSYLDWVTEAPGPDAHETDPVCVIRSRGLIDLRRPGKTSVVVIPERLSGGVISPCAYIRLLLPLDHPAIGGDIALTIAEPGQSLNYRADVVITHRHAILDPREADDLAAHCAAQGQRLLVDLDDDLLDIPKDHPEWAMLEPRGGAVRRLLTYADEVWTSTETLRQRIASPNGPPVRVIPNGLDERLWSALPQPSAPRSGTMRIVIMGTATHERDLAIVMPALARLTEDFGYRMTFDLIGMTAQGDLPGWLRRVQPPHFASVSYPGFVDWITGIPGWDVGLVPLSDTPFNAAKSAIKTLDYAALGLAVLASDVPAYRGSLADGTGGMLVANAVDDWYDALQFLMRNPRLRQTLSDGARTALAAEHTLSAQAPARRAEWLRFLATPKRAFAPLQDSRRAGPPRRVAGRRRMTA